MPEEPNKPETPEEPEKPVAEVKQITDYKDKAKRKGGQPQDVKAVEKVIVGEVVIQKKSFGRKARDAVVAADFKSVGGYLIWDVMIPAVKNMIVDTATKGIERAIYGDRAIRSRNNIGNRESRLTTHRYPYEQRHSDPLNRNRALDARGREISQRAVDREKYILPTREDADRVIDEMTDIIERDDFVTLATLKELIGVRSDHVDYKWGWRSLVGVQSVQVREGYLIDFPSPIQVDR